MLLVGYLLGDVPAGWVVARVGERKAMLGALVVGATGLVLSALAPNPPVLGLAIGLIGVAAAIFGLARHSLVTILVPRAYRARALSTLGGSYRLGHVVGPFLSASILTATGGITGVFWLCLVLLVLVAGSLVLLPDPESVLRARRPEGLPVVAPLDVFRTIGARRGTLLRLGSAGLIVSAVRATRQVLIPLWAVSIGVGDARTALVIGIAALVDFVLFYPGGWLMDRYGLVVTSAPPMIGMGLAFIVLAFSGGATDPVAWFIGVTIALALTHGLSSGILMTMGSSLAGRRNPAPFLGAWRLVLDGGRAGAPLVISAITAGFGLAAAAASFGAVAIVGAALLAWFIPREPDLRRRTR
jgi:MFS family permease